MPPPAAAAPTSPLLSVLNAGQGPGGSQGTLDALLGRLGVDFSNIGPLNTPSPAPVNRPTNLNSGTGTTNSPLALPPRGPLAEPEEERRQIQFGLGGTIINDTGNPRQTNTRSPSGEPRQEDFDNYGAFRSAELRHRITQSRRPPTPPTASEFFASLR